MAEFKREMVWDVWEESQELIKAHWQEIAHYPDIPLDPDKEAYYKAELLGILRVFTCRIENELVGYCVFYVKGAAHYKSSIQAVEDIVFLHPKVRGKTIGLRMIKWCDQELKKEGVQVVYHHVKKSHPQLGKILEHVGYEHIDSIYGRRL